MATNARIPYRRFFDRRAVIDRSINQVHCSVMPVRIAKASTISTSGKSPASAASRSISSLAVCQCRSWSLSGSPFSLRNCIRALPDFLVSVAAHGGSSCLDSCNRAKPQMIRVSCRIFRVRTRLRTRRKGDPDSEFRISQPDRMTPGSSVGGSLMVCRSEWSRTTSEKLTVATRWPASS